MAVPPSKTIGRAPQDILGGLILLMIGALALYLVRELPATSRIGFASGTAPRLFAYALLGLGTILMVLGFFKSGPGIDKPSLRGPLAILGSIVFFALAIRDLGLAVTGIPMVMIATAASPGYRWREAVLFALAMTVFCALLFPFALGQPIPLWPEF